MEITLVWLCLQMKEGRDLQIKESVEDLEKLRNLNNLKLEGAYEFSKRADRNFFVAVMAKK